MNKLFWEEEMTDSIKVKKVEIDSKKKSLRQLNKRLREDKIGTKYYIYFCFG